METKLLDEAQKFIEETNVALSSFDIHEQNQIISVICNNIMSIRKDTLDKMQKDRESFAIKTDEFIKILQDIK